MSATSHRGISPLQTLDDETICQAAGLTHGLESVATTGLFQGGQQGDQESAAGGAQWVAQSDCATVLVDLGDIDPSVL